MNEIDQSQSVLQGQVHRGTADDRGVAVSNDREINGVGAMTVGARNAILVGLTPQLHTRFALGFDLACRPCQCRMGFVGPPRTTNLQSAVVATQSCIVDKVSACGRHVGRTLAHLRDELRFGE